MFVPFTVQNSINLPAVFVLRLNEPMPICLQLADNIKSVTEMDLEMSPQRSLLRMIIEPSSQPLSVVSLNIKILLFNYFLKHNITIK